ncbi:response regulator receiver domain [Pseudomonas fluorescens]|jgi:Response receiver domain|uniref:response regulator receiver domain n=1 Tax=Pseudomonas fluorescens TaxID=294 RepID=UPI0020C38203|nr:response regulator receiver domain [Pseudomonas fluorescens]UTL93130.1 response regulator receiver domain [Pseudomonas fluorescens]
MIESLEDSLTAKDEAVPVVTYSDFIEEVFISPIRTAVVVDDEFPTLDEFLSGAETANSKKHFDRARDIIKFCRTRQPYPWIVDIHDGKNISVSDEQKSATHFDHTDLLVLDYHLKGEQHGGELAINILKRLAKNEHFNLVIIYTNNDVSLTLREVGLSLCHVDRIDEFFSRLDLEKVEKVYDEWADSEDPIITRLYDSIDPLAFIRAVHMDDVSFSQTKTLEEFAGFYEILETKEIKFRREDMLKLFLKLKSPEFKEYMGGADYGEVAVSESGSVGGFSDVNWLQVDSLFLTVVKKSEVAPEYFTQRLKAAIAAWDPSPHKLIVSKIRSEISRRGVMVEKEVLRNPYLQAAWLHGLFDANTQVRQTNFTKSFSKHWDSLGGRVEPEVLNFAQKMGSHLVAEGVNATRFQNPAYSASPLMALYVNHNECSKRIEGHHLLTGHVLLIDEELWVCLTPACDLEPGRGVSDDPEKKSLGDWKPFKAARIQVLVDETQALVNAARGHHLFLSIDGGCPKAYTFAIGSDPTKMPTLKWQQFYAAKQGVFDAGVRSFRVVSNFAEKGVIKTSESVAEVVAQLRYEYALHLLQHLGGHLSRVGLDFISYKHK